MFLRKLLISATAISLSAGPVLAQATQPAPANPLRPVPAQAQQPAPAPAPARPAAPAPAQAQQPAPARPAAPAPAQAQQPAPAPAKPAAQPSQAQTKRININTANADELDALKGIGPARAKKIIEERQKARFKNFQDLVDRNVLPSNVEADIRDKISF
jgi:competence protein ComEA